MYALTPIVVTCSDRYDWVVCRVSCCIQAGERVLLSWAAAFMLSSTTEDPLYPAGGAVDPALQSSAVV